VLDKSLGKLIRMNLQDFWLDEAKNFTPWLARNENLELLSSTLGMELEKEGVEVPVGPYRADIVARALSSDTKAIIENQLGKTDHDHLGKAITYASGLDAQIMIWIAKEFSEEHRRALDFLNENAAPDLRCFGVEIQLWRVDDSRPAPACVRHMYWTNVHRPRCSKESTAFWSRIRFGLMFLTIAAGNRVSDSRLRCG
jgi:hypothetical protein